MPGTCEFKPRDCLGVMIQIGTLAGGVILTNHINNLLGKAYSNGSLYLNAHYPWKWTLQLNVWALGLAFTCLAASALSYFAFSAENKEIALIPVLPVAACCS